MSKLNSKKIIYDKQIVAIELYEKYILLNIIESNGDEFREKIDDLAQIDSKLENMTLSQFYELLQGCFENAPGHSFSFVSNYKLMIAKFNVTFLYGVQINFYIYLNKISLKKAPEEKNIPYVIIFTCPDDKAPSTDEVFGCTTQENLRNDILNKICDYVIYQIKMWYGDETEITIKIIKKILNGDDLNSLCQEAWNPNAFINGKWEYVNFGNKEILEMIFRRNGKTIKDNECYDSDDDDDDDN